MSVEEQKAVVRRFVEEFWNKGNVAIADELLSAHATIVSAIQTMSDAEWRAKIPNAGTRRQSVVTLVGGVLGAPQRPFGHAFAHVSDLQGYVESVRRES